MKIVYYYLGKYNKVYFVEYINLYYNIIKENILLSKYFMKKFFKKLYFKIKDAYIITLFNPKSKIKKICIKLITKKFYKPTCHMLYFNINKN